MPDTGWVLTGTCTNFAMPGSTGANWVNLSNATVIDSNYAHVNQTATGNTNALRASNFDFSGIPADAHIDGIEVLLDGLHRTGVIAQIDQTNIVQPDGTRDVYDIPLTPANTDLTPTDTTGGGSNDRLSTALTVADVQDTNFGFLTNVTTSQTTTIEMRIESMQMRITYHEGFPAPLGSGEQMGGGKKGPFFYNGYVYALVTRTIAGSNNIALQVVRTQTPEKGNWEELDTGTTSEMASSNLLLYSDAIAAKVIDNFLHIVRISSDGLGSNIYYRRFNLSTNTWVTTADETWINNVDILAPAVDIHCISASNIYVVYSGEVDRVMGGDKLRVDYAHWNGTAWTTGQALDNAGDVHYGSPVVCEGNGADDVHFAWLRQTSTANDPPNDWADIQGRTHLGSGGLNGTWDTFTFSSITAGGIGVSLRALTRDAGTIRAYLAENTSGDLGFALGTEIGANNTIDFTSDAQDTDTISIDTNTRSIIVEDQWVFDVIYDPITSKYYMVHSDPATDDLYYRESVSGTTWSASVEILDGVTRCDDISINVYTRGIDTVLAVLYTDNKVTYYTEYVVAQSGTQFNQSVAGSATATGAIVKQAQPVLTGSSTATGTLARVSSFLRTVTGSLTATGALLKETALSFAGSSTWTGALASTKVAFQNLAGSLAATGTVARATTFAAAVSGSLTATGALLKQAQATLAGSATATGALLKQAQITLTGSSTWTGFLDAVLDAGQQFNQAVGGSLTAAGALARQSAFVRTLTGSSTWTGQVFKGMFLDLAGSSTFTGALSATKTFLQALAGSLTATGALARQSAFVRTLTGSSTWTGTVGRATTFATALAGSMTATGQVFKGMFLDLAGSSTFTGALATTKVVLQALAGSLTATGNILKQAQLTFTGSSAWTGAVARVTTFTAALGGSVVATGELLKQARVTLTGSSTWTGAVDGVLQTVGNFFQSVGGSITATGALTKQTQLTFAGAVAATGSVFKGMFRTFTGSVTAVGNMVEQVTFLQSMAGSLAAAGAVFKQKQFTLAGIATATGNLVKQTQLTFTGSVTAAGNIVRDVSTNLSGSLAATGAMTESFIANQAAAGASLWTGVLAGVIIGPPSISAAVNAFRGYLGTLIGRQNRR